jgi:hypothetical protein
MRVQMGDEPKLETFLQKIFSGHFYQCGPFRDDAFQYPAILGKRMIDIADQVIGCRFYPVIELIAAMVIAKFLIGSSTQVFTTLPALRK